MQTTPATAIQLTIETGETGLLGTISVRVLDLDAGTAIPASTADITEVPGGSGFYVADRISPATRGDYVVQWSLDGSYDDDSIVTDDLAVRSNAFPIGDDADPSGIDLCTLADVFGFVPGYRSNDTTDAKLQQLITAESSQLMIDCGREIVSAFTNPQTREFAVNERAQTTRRIPIGDLASCGDTDIAVELLATDGTVAVTYTRSQYRPQYRARRLYPRDTWEPVVALEFPAGLGGRGFLCGQTVLVTGNWGFPAIPYAIRQACAKRVILRYITEVASTGDSLSEALQNVNLAGLFASARDAVESLVDRTMIS